MKRILLFTILLLFVSVAQAQDEITHYRRSSLYSILITHQGQTFSNDIKNVFYEIPIPEKFDDHNLSVRVVASNTTKNADKKVIDSFIEKNHLARRMTAKWFNRIPEEGTFNMDLIASRGHYDATYFDVSVAELSARGVARIADAGEELIGNTFLLVNDIKYADKRKTASTASIIFKSVGVIAGIAMDNTDLIDLTNDVGDIIASIEGFRVIVTSYLYRLEWNDEIAGTLYHSYYMTNDDFDENKKTAFDNENQLFKLKYIGKQSVQSGKTSFEGINPDTPSEMIRKVCTRAIDKSIVQLQRAHEEFRVKTPIYHIDDKVIQAKIGLKEGVTTQSQFEVLEQYEDNKGKIQYRRVGIIRPVSGKIWDNRYMAVEEKAKGATLNYTEFRKVSGGNFYPGMLIREIK